MKEIRTEDAVGHVLCHDITQIIKDEKKGVLFKKVTSFAKKIFRHFFPSEKNIFMFGKNKRVFFTKMKRQKFSTIYPLIFICTAVISKKERSN